MVLNAGSVIQCHSLEDGTFKSDRTTLGDGVVLGVGAFVHYGVAMGEGSMLDADGFLMKGEEAPPFTRWSGNPATEARPRSRTRVHQHPLETPRKMRMTTAARLTTAQPFVNTPLPGPRSAELLERQALRESNARVYPRHFPIAVAEAHGSYIRDLDGNVFIDFLAGAGVLSLGHNHPELVEAADAAAVGLHATASTCPHPPRTRSPRRSCRCCPSEMRDRMKIQFCGPDRRQRRRRGAQAVQDRDGTGRHHRFPAAGSTAARTLPWRSPATVAQKAPVANGMPGVHFFPYPYGGEPDGARRRDTWDATCAALLETALTDPNGGIPRPAAVIMEMVQGEGGVDPGDAASSRSGCAG